MKKETHSKDSWLRRVRNWLISAAVGGALLLGLCFLAANFLQQSEDYASALPVLFYLLLFVTGLGVGATEGVLCKGGLGDVWLSAGILMSALVVSGLFMGGGAVSFLRPTLGGLVLLGASSILPVVARRGSGKKSPRKGVGSKGSVRRKKS